MYNEAAGLWWHNRYRAILESVANILLNYFLGKYLGINGILLATILTILIINFLYGSQIIYKYYFTEMRIRKYYISNGIFIIVTMFVGILTYKICGIVPENIGGFFAKMGICIFVPNLVYFIVYRNTKMYNDAVSWILKKIKVQEGSLVWKMMLK